MNWGCGGYLRLCQAEVLCAHVPLCIMKVRVLVPSGDVDHDFKLHHMALRGCAVVALVERQGEYYTDVVCDACAIMWVLQHTSVQTVGPHCHVQCYRVESSDCQEILCCKVAKSCGCEFLMGRALHLM